VDSGFPYQYFGDGTGIVSAGEVDNSYWFYQMLVIKGPYLFAGTKDGGIWRRPISEIAAIKNELPKTINSRYSRILRTEYFSLNGRKLSVANGKAIAPAGMLVIKRSVEAGGVMRMSKVMIK
jgi:hypothetical protein